MVTFAYWAVHGSVDWFWELPALAAPAFAWLGLAGGLARMATTEGAPPGSGATIRKKLTTGSTERAA